MKQVLFIATKNMKQMCHITSFQIIYQYVAQSRLKKNVSEGIADHRNGFANPLGSADLLLRTTYQQNSKWNLPPQNLASILCSVVSTIYLFLDNFFFLYCIQPKTICQACKRLQLSARESLAMSDLLHNLLLPQIFTLLNKCDNKNKGSNVHIFIFFKNIVLLFLKFIIYINLRCMCQVCHCTRNFFFIVSYMFVTQVCFKKSLAWDMSQYMSGTSCICNVQPFYPVFLTMNGRSI